ncbi:hypothetical protein AO377_1217 [Moraxella catarrhalis]|uniref:DUF4411 family protein n=1 Tax=Moraxella catarrhalis TaxID=480 RepID=UPI0007E4A634|nr:DUF4411 family protein [Moraxella catarrhalis]OAV09300.1 hypothetical protein AO377_1217 [Moraxella catarrhalis]OAV16555.1 hypothetical protein AO375_0441 [Moraxella catarrhalis]OAV36345.1 hypothetical protein AO365_0740 [Moraxella catarrhalis]
MKVFCLDTNAILDFCYRFYPKDVFSALWEEIDAAIFAKQIEFVITKDIHDEITAQILKMRYDSSVFDDFKTQFHVRIIDDYDEELAKLKSNLMSIAKNFPPHKLDHLNNDLSNICLNSKYHSVVITSEQGFNNDLSRATNSRDLKIPDICRHLGVECGNWLLVFSNISFKL